MDLPDFMTILARNAGDFAEEAYSHLQNGQFESKATEKDIVTAADRLTEEFIIQRIHRDYPDHNIFGEEHGAQNNSASPYLWVIDPIDGTTNYAAGSPRYCVSIGLMKNDEFVAGAIYSPRTCELFAAEKGSGATLNGEKIAPSRKTELIQCIGTTGFACLRANLKKNNLETFCHIAPLLRDIHRTGSAALDLCDIACGRGDFFWEYPLGLYDVAAGIVIVREAGGLVSDFDNGNAMPQRGVIASCTPQIHEQVRALVLQHDYRK